MLHGKLLENESVIFRISMKNVENMFPSYKTILKISPAIN